MREIRPRRLLAPAGLGVALSSALLVAGSATGAGIGQLKSELNSTQAQLGATQAHQKTLDGSISALNSQVSSLAGHIGLVQSREQQAQTQLSQYDTALSEAKAQLSTERARLRMLRRRLSRARRALADELVSQYEQPEQSFMSIVVDAHGFSQLLSQLEYVSSINKQEQAVIRTTESARSQTIAATARIGKLEAADARAASAADTQTQALSGMASLLSSQEAALNDERAAQSTALSASQAKGAQLQQAIKQINQQEEAAEQAAQTITPTPAGGGTSTTGTNSGGGGLGAGAGWAIPYPIVLCESGGQNLPPNGAGASGYYQIIPSTWKDYGGSGPAAYLAPKSEQDAVAAKIWNGGAGASSWTCSGIVGIS